MRRVLLLRLLVLLLLLLLMRLVLVLLVTIVGRELVVRVATHGVAVALIVGRQDTPFAINDHFFDGIEITPKLHSPLVSKSHAVFHDFSYVEHLQY